MLEAWGRYVQGEMVASKGIARRAGFLTVLLWTVSSTALGAKSQSISELYLTGPGLEALRLPADVAVRDELSKRAPSIEIQSLSPKFIRLSIKPDGMPDLDAIGGALRRRFYTVCLSPGFEDSEAILFGWSGFLDATRMMGSQSWEWSMGASVWGRY